MIIIDKLSYSSGLADVSPEEKFAYAVLTLLVCVVSRSVTAAVTVLAVNGILNVKKGRVPFHLYLKYLMVPLIFLLLSTLAILVNVSKEPLDAYAIPVGQYYVTSSWMGLKKGGQMILTALASVSSLYVLSFNTPMTEILDVLKRLHFPGLFIELMLLTYRFIFILDGRGICNYDGTEDRIAACFYHIMKIFLYHIGFRCRVGCRDMLLPDNSLDVPIRPTLYPAFSRIDFTI